MLKFVHILILYLSLACLAGINQIQTWTIEKLLRKFYAIYKELKTIYLLSESRIPWVIGYSYSDFFGCADSKKFISYYIFIFGRGLISWKSVR
jgi:hypothetical protein